MAVITLFLIGRAQAFEPLNTDDAGTVKKGGNQIEMYFYSINKVNQPTGPGQDTSSPGEEFLGLGSSPGGPTRNENTNLRVGIFLNVTLSNTYMKTHSTNRSRDIKLLSIKRTEHHSLRTLVLKRLSNYQK